MRQPPCRRIEAGRTCVRLRSEPDGSVIDAEEPSDHRVMQRAAGTAPLVAGLHEQRPQASAQCIRDPEAQDNASVVFKDPALAALSKHLVIFRRRSARRVAQTVLRDSEPDGVHRFDVCNSCEPYSPDRHLIYFRTRCRLAGVARNAIRRIVKTIRPLLTRRLLIKNAVAAERIRSDSRRRNAMGTVMLGERAERPASREGEGLAPLQRILNRCTDSRYLGRVTLLRVRARAVWIDFSDRRIPSAADTRAQAELAHGVFDHTGRNHV